MNTQTIVILVGLEAVAALLLLLRFGKIIVRYALIFGGLVVVAMLGLALFEHSRATRQAMQVATIACLRRQASAGNVAGAAGVSIAVVVLAVLLLAATATAGVFYVRWRLFGGYSPRPRWPPGPNAYWRGRRPQLGRAAERPVVYYIPDDDNGDDVTAGEVLDDLGIQMDSDDWGFS